MKIIFNNGAEFECYNVMGGHQNIQGAYRDTLTFNFPSDKYSMDELNKQFSSVKNCEVIRLVQPSGSMFVHKGYTILTEMKKTIVQIAAEQDAEAAPAYEARVSVSVAQRTLLENQLNALMPAYANTLEGRKAQYIAISKSELIDYLKKHPLVWVDGKSYSVTEEKQNQLTGTIAAYQIESQINPAAKLMWNATGEACTEWTMENLCALAIDIKNYVRPLVAYQQEVEIRINACTDIEDVKRVEINYHSVYGTTPEDPEPEYETIIVEPEVVVPEPPIVEEVVEPVEPAPEEPVVENTEETPVEPVNPEEVPAE